MWGVVADIKGRRLGFCATALFTFLFGLLRFLLLLTHMLQTLLFSSNLQGEVSLVSCMDVFIANTKISKFSFKSMFKPMLMRYCLFLLFFLHLRIYFTFFWISGGYGYVFDLFGSTYHARTFIIR